MSTRHPQARHDRLMPALAGDGLLSVSIARALAYPGALVSEPMVLSAPGDTRSRVTDIDLTARAPVLALGSNGSLPTLRAKLLVAGVSPVVPLFPALVTGLVLTHSAHVSLGGYVAATPLEHREGATRGVLAWFSPAQLAVLDASEPNYVRQSADLERYPLSLLGGPSPARFGVYRSIWGVLTSNGRPLRLRTQAALHRALANDRDVATRLPLGDPVAVVRRLRLASTRLWIRRHWSHSGQACTDGLDLVG
jgi:hypothetical protein